MSFIKDIISKAEKFAKDVHEYKENKKNYESSTGRVYEDKIAAERQKNKTTRLDYQEKRDKEFAKKWS